MQDPRPASKDHVPGILVLAAGPVPPVRHALAYLRKKYPEAPIAILADPALPSGIRVEETIAPSEKQVLKQRKFGVVALVHARGRPYWLRQVRLANLARSIGCEHKIVITGEGYLFPFEFTRSVLQLFLIPFCRFVVSPLLVLYSFPATKLVRFLVGLHSPNHVREIDGWPSANRADCASANTSLMRRQFELLSRGNAGKVPHGLCRARACVVCREDDPERFFESEDGFDYVRCKGCGYVYVNPILGQAGWELLEREIPDYKLTASEPFSEHRQSEEGYADDVERFSSYLRLIGKHLKSPGRILDVGCSTGNFPRLARSRGWEVVGLEVEESRCQIARERYGLDMVCGKIEEVGTHPLLSAGSFDVVTFWESMEHIEDPNPAMERARDLLKDGGLLALTVNNIDYINALLLKQQCFDLLGIGHINMFNAATMSAWLTRFGFTPMTIRTLDKPSLRELVAFLGCDENRIYSFANFDRQAARSAQSEVNGRLETYPRSKVETMAFVNLFFPWLHHQTNSLSLGPMLFAIGKKRSA